MEGYKGVIEIYYSKRDPETGRVGLNIEGKNFYWYMLLDKIPSTHSFNFKEQELIKIIFIPKEATLQEIGDKVSQIERIVNTATTENWEKGEVINKLKEVEKE